MTLEQVRSYVRAALKTSAEWLKLSGGTEAEIQALREAFREIEAADPANRQAFEFPLV
jgi:ferric-dicitrate binding protein FerR (iron transport regulator)